ncbi:MAG TPA: hypothetical protein VNJ02_13145 [Vicinamibacterales bacterium]|nr:hypothetical protein [Vicinamibacterales bacterium]
MLRRTSPRIAVVLGYVLVALAFTWPLALQMGTALTGDPGGDTGVYIWNQWVFQHEALVRGRNPFTTEQVLSLTRPVDLSQHNYTVFLNVLALPLIPILGVVATFNVVLLTVSVMTALATYALVRHVTDASRPEAWLAGVAFAWSPVLVARSTAHFSLVAAAPLAVFVLFLSKAHQSRKASHAALAGACMAWAGFCDAYYAVFCLLIASAYLTARWAKVRFDARTSPWRWRWTLDSAIGAVALGIVAIVVTGGGVITIAGVEIRAHGLYTPVLLLTVLVLARLTIQARPYLLMPTGRWSPAAVRVLLIGVFACAVPLSPVLYGLGQRVADGRYVSPPTLWRSSPRGVDLLGLFTFNPNHPVARWFNDQQTAQPTVFVEYTASLSLVALVIFAFAVWRGGYRPRAAWIWLAAGFAALSLGPFIYLAGFNTHVPGPWALLRYVPLIGTARTPTRFAVVAALGVAILFAGALAALGRRYPEKRRLIVSLAGVALLLELLPAPRTLYSAEMPRIYDIVAADPQPVRIIELPIGVRDGTFAAGDFSSRYLYYQTRHGKRLIGGYLSRISQKRVREVRSQATVDALLTLSEGRSLTPAQEDRVRAKGPSFIRRSRVGYVVINHARAPQALIDFAADAWNLHEIAREGPMVLYRPVVRELTANELIPDP